MNLQIKKNWGLVRLKKNMNRIFSEIQSYISKQEAEKIEYGNLRRGAKWGLKKGDRLIWIFEVDLIWSKPLQYKVIYNVDDGTFSGSSDFGHKLKFDNLIQFNCKNLNELVEKIVQLAKNIPSFRERILREYVFSKIKNKVNTRWSKLFQKKEQHDTEEAYLIYLIEKMHRNQRISDLELERTTHYVNKLKA